MTAPITSISQCIESYLEQYPIVDKGHLLLDFRGFYARVDSNSEVLISKLSDYFRDFIAPMNGNAAAREYQNPTVVITAIEAPALEPDSLQLDFTVKQPDPGKTKIKEEYIDLPDGRIVRKRLTGIVYAFGNGQHFCIGPCIQNDNQVVNFINNRFIEHCLHNQCLLFHAAGVTHADESRKTGLAMAGFSGMGKSTLALHIMSLGSVFVSNDRLMISKGGEKPMMYGVAKMPRINPGTALNNPDLHPVMNNEDRQRFSSLPLDELWNLEYKYDAFIDQCFGPNKFRISSPMSGLILLNWRRDSDQPLKMAEVCLKDRPDLMPSFMKSVGLFYDPEPDVRHDFSEQAYLDLLQNTPVYELTGGIDFHLAAHMCMELL